MNDEPQQMLSEETIETIQDLIQANIDSHNGFEYAAAQLDDPVAYELFHRLALERLSNSWELHKLVADNRKTPATQGTVKGGLHRVFMKLRHQLNHDDLVFVTEANRGEAYITAMYESLLEPAAGKSVISRSLSPDLRYSW
jgi:uncharacterized protein (TIGR02284 family)